MPNTLHITANGEAFEIPLGTPLSAFLEARGQAPGRVVVERNGEALPPSLAAQTTLENGDRLEIVRIVAGG